ncbi:uncharacterized protein DUF4352 [Diaminobutyricimonas aerilata]|uniref:Uncharacterized protein DUF4352 n=1 Tax=Diaminobutyricimonas aerilata TaxID=1162967 RepID=A0A2M9CF46_9MICO|nr:DUF4352 domain-containing protein [Diaminobutyricimonas aerilata]PJJ70508.1 uncharacterized protein DUF4352 [Diaminobutyricimonas aerilata]
MSYDPASVPPPPPAPSPYAAPAQPAGPAGAPPTGRVNGLGIAALAVGAVGLVVAFVPFIGALGGFLGFVGLVLGIIGLVLKGRKKGLAIAGTIVSGVALIASIVMIFVYTASYINAFNDAIESGPSVVDEAPPAEGEEEAEGIEPGGVGSRENPAPIGSTVSIEAITGAAWEVSLGAPTLNATDLVKAASEYNPDPAAGNQYAIVPATITNVGEANGSPFELTFEFVDADGRSYTGGYVSMEGQLADVDELLPGASATGNVVIEIPSAGAEAGTWAVAHIMGDPIYFAAQ